MMDSEPPRRPLPIGSLPESISSLFGPQFAFFGLYVFTLFQRRTLHSKFWKRFLVPDFFRVQLYEKS
jgi:hypothetical protein